MAVATAGLLPKHSYSNSSFFCAICSNVVAKNNGTVRIPSVCEQSKTYASRIVFLQR